MKIKRSRVVLAVLVVVLGVLVFQLQCGEQYKPLRIAVAGTPEQVGASFGRQCGPSARKLYPMFLRLAVVASAHGKEDLYTRARDIAEHIAEEDVREMKALAEAAGMSYEDVLFLNVWYNLVSNRVFCRQLAVWGKRTEDGELIHARNLDWPDYPGKPLCKNNLILDVKPQGGLEYVILTWPGLIGALT